MAKRKGPKPVPPEERFWSNVQKSEGCWQWTGPLDPYGYGSARHPERRSRYVKAHRRAYELLIGPIPGGLPLDHECHNLDPGCPGGVTCPHRACVRPDHLIPRRQGENVLRSPRTGPAINVAKTTCPQGHPYDGRGTKGERLCGTCRRQCQKLYWQRRGSELRRQRRKGER